MKLALTPEICYHTGVKVEGILEFFVLSPSSVRTHRELIQKRRGIWETFRDVLVH
jgi:hypothetical protein